MLHQVDKWEVPLVGGIVVVDLPTLDHFSLNHTPLDHTPLILQGTSILQQDQPLCILLKVKWQWKDNRNLRNSLQCTH